MNDQIKAQAITTARASLEVFLITSIFALLVVGTVAIEAGKLLVLLTEALQSTKNTEPTPTPPTNINQKRVPKLIYQQVRDELDNTTTVNMVPERGLATLTVMELRLRCRHHSIKGASRLSRNQCIAALESLNTHMELAACA